MKSRMSQHVIHGLNVLLLSFLGGLLLLCGANPAKAEDYSDVTINILTSGPTIVRPVTRRAAEFAKLTGAMIHVTEVKFADDLYEMLFTDFSSGSKKYDAAVYPSMWMADFAEPGYLEDLTKRVEADAALEWEDVAPFFRKIVATYRQRVYSIPFDGDFHMMYYRADILDRAGLKPPGTWTDYIEVAKVLHGQDVNDDGEPDYGSCISKAPRMETYWFVISVAAPFIQSEGTSQGVFFDTRDMKPLIKNEAFEFALDIFVETLKYGPPNELELGTSDTRKLFINGRCGLIIDWGDIGTLAISPESKVKDKVGAAILPGSQKVLDRDTGKLIDCDESRCPYTIDGVNHAPFAAFGGWAGVINAGSPARVKDAAYAFLSYMSQPQQSNVDVTIGITGFNPYRFSQFRTADPWLKAGMSKDVVKLYLGGIGKSLNNRNMALDLKIPQSHRYLGEVLDRVIHKRLTGQISTQEAVIEIEQGWNEITDEVGREAQLKAYLLSLGRKVK